MGITTQMRSDYDDYLKQHIGNVKLGLEWLFINLPEIFSRYDADYIGNNIAQHDASKYSCHEYDAYCAYFYGKKTAEVKEQFDYAWLHHIHNNPHHWQYWLLKEDNGDLKALEMPYEYIIEMICDHWAFSWKADNLYEIFDWYEKNRSKMILHKNTQKNYEDILDKLKKKLDEVSANGKEQ